MLRILDIRHHRFTADQRLFLDANVWMYIYGIFIENNPSPAYSQAFTEILNQGCELHTDPLVLSEIVNTAARILWQGTYPDKKGGYKKYRKKPEFQPMARKVAETIKAILKLPRLRLVPSPLSARTLSALMDDYQHGGMDFNDQLFAQICHDHRLIFITHDSDFTAPQYPRHDFTLLTAQPKHLP